MRLVVGVVVFEAALRTCFKTSDALLFATQART